MAEDYGASAGSVLPCGYVDRLSVNREQTMTDWPALIKRLRARNSCEGIAAELGVRRETVWRWAAGKGKPRADCAVILIRMDVASGSAACRASIPSDVAA